MSNAGRNNMSKETTSDKPATLPGVALDPVIRPLKHDDITAMDQRISYLADKFFPHLTRTYGRLCVLELLRDAQRPNDQAHAPATKSL